MTPPAAPERDKNPRFPSEIISHGLWLYDRFPLSYRDVQELWCERGLDVPHEAIRQWCLTCGQDYANQLKHRRAQPGDTWPVDEVCLTINGKRHDLGRAVDHAENGRALLVQSWRKQQAATKCLRKVLQGLQYVPRGVMTDKRQSDGAAKRARLPGVEPRQRRSRTHRCEHAPRPTRPRA
jgi:putative transposase